MDILQITFFVVLCVGVLVATYVLISAPGNGNATLAAMLCAGFAAYTAVQIWHEGAAMFFTNHTANLTGIQVWSDLVICVVIALFFILPRARAVGMNPVPWTLLVLGTASIGLLAMCARLFWLESQREPATAETAKARLSKPPCPGTAPCLVAGPRCRRPILLLSRLPRHLQDRPRR